MRRFPKPRRSRKNTRGVDVNIRSGRSQGRPRAWTEQRLIAAGHEWAQRHGRLPRASDWATAKARAKGADAWSRLQDPPHGASRWPPASTINDTFETWDRFRERCDSPPNAQTPPAEAPATLRFTHGHFEICVHDGADLVDEIHAHWMATGVPPRANEFTFVNWALWHGHATALCLSELPSNIVAGDFERFLWEVMRSRRHIRLTFHAPRRTRA